MGVKYTYTFTSRRGITVKVDIDDRDWSGGVTTIVPHTSDHATTRWQMSERNPFARFAGSETRIRFHDTANSDILKDIYDLAADNKRLRLIITKAAAVWWQGFIERPQFRYAEDYVRHGEVTAVDGLSLLDDIPFVVDETADPYVYYTGRARAREIIIECLKKIGLAQPYALSCNLYVKNLTETDNPLDHYYHDRERLRNTEQRTRGRGVLEEEETVNTPWTCRDVLEEILSRYGLRVFQYKNAWHVVDAHLYTRGTPYREWFYDVAGAPAGTSLFDPTMALTPGTASIDNTRASGGAWEEYGGVAVTTEHGKYVILKNSTFDDSYVTQQGIIGAPDTELLKPWEVVGSATAKEETKDKAALPSVPAVYEDLPATPAALAARIATLVGNNTTGIVTQDSEVQVIAGTKLVFYAEALAALGLRVRKGSDLWPCFRIQLKDHPKTPTERRYYDADTNTWVLGTDTWIVGRREKEGAYVPFAVENSWGGYVLELAALPVNGYLQVDLGPLFETTIGGQPTGDIIDVRYDNVYLDYITPDGTFHADATTTFNYVDRASSRIYEHPPNLFGDAIFLDQQNRAALATSISLDANGAGYTDNWSDGAPASGTSGDSLDMLLSRLMLRSLNHAQNVVTMTVHGLNPTPEVVNVLNRGGSFFPPYTIEIDHRLDTSNGTWYQAREDGFTDDLTTGFSNKGKSFNRGRDSTAGFLMRQNQQAFYSEYAKRITLTDTNIAAGNHTVISVETMQEPLLNNGSLIIIIAPNMDYVTAQVTMDQVAGAKTIHIGEVGTPANPVNFPSDFTYPCAIFLLEAELTAVARLGEYGYALNVLETPWGRANETFTGETRTSMSITGWESDTLGALSAIKAGQTIYVMPAGVDPIPLVLTNDVDRGDQTVQFQSTTFSVTSGDAVTVASQAQSARIDINANRILILVERQDASSVIAVLKTSIPADTLFSQIEVNSLDTDVSSGDEIFLLDDAGLERKLTVNGTVQRTKTSVFIPVQSTQFDNNGATAPKNISLHGSSMYGKIRVEAERIDLEVARFQNAAILTAQEAVAGVSRSSLLVSRAAAFPAGEYLRLGDTVRLVHMATGSYYYLLLTQDLQVPGSGNVTINFQAQVITCDIGDPCQAGSVTAIRLGLDGIDVQAPVIKSSTFDGTLDSDGNLTATGTVGWADNKGGDRYAMGGILRMDSDGFSLPMSDNDIPDVTPKTWKLTFRNPLGGDEFDVYGRFSGVHSKADLWMQGNKLALGKTALPQPGEPDGFYFGTARLPETGSDAFFNVVYAALGHLVGDAGSGQYGGVLKEGTNDLKVSAALANLFLQGATGAALQALAGGLALTATDNLTVTSSGGDIVHSASEHQFTSQGETAVIAGGSVRLPTRAPIAGAQPADPDASYLHTVNDTETSLKRLYSTVWSSITGGLLIAYKVAYEGIKAFFRWVELENQSSAPPNPPNTGHSALWPVIGTDGPLWRQKFHDGSVWRVGTYLPGSLTGMIIAAIEFDTPASYTTSDFDIASNEKINVTRARFIPNPDQDGAWVGVTIGDTSVHGTDWSDQMFTAAYFTPPTEDGTPEKEVLSFDFAGYDANEAYFKCSKGSSPFEVFDRHVVFLVTVFASESQLDSI